MTNRTRHVWKTNTGRVDYANRLNDSGGSESTLKDDSTELSSSTTIKEKDRPIKEKKRRPVHISTKIWGFLKENWVIGITITALIGLFIWLITNDFVFKSDISVINVNLTNLKDNSFKDNESLEKRVENGASKIEEMWKDIIFIKTSHSKDIEIISEKINRDGMVMEK